jgi:phage N-6-adenine-methyltransferase
MGIGKENKFKSDTVEYETPKELFEPLKKEFNIEFDVCASATNAKCERYWTKEENALEKKWEGVCWMNPPYGRDLKKWVRKAYESSLNGATVVCLLPVRSNTNWWHDYVMKGEIRFIRGRVRFEGHKKGMWLPLCVVIFRGRQVAATHGV